MIPEAIGTAVGTEFLKSTVRKVQDFIANEITIKKIKKDLKKENEEQLNSLLSSINEERINNLHQRISEVRKVKTLWQRGKAVDLTSFFCAPYVTSHKNERIKVEELDALGSEQCILINGIAGHGKTILMRYLCGRELYRDRYIPLFIQLRNIGPDKKLKDVVYSELSLFGIQINDDIFQFITDSCHILLLLDGFDEVAQEHRINVLEQINMISRAYKHLRVIVSSRPDNGCERLGLFKVVALDYYNDTEYSEVIYKLSESKPLADDLIKKIEGKKEYENLFATPLMITILLISYRSNPNIPDHLTDFYNKLFYTLIDQHDGLKALFERKFLCDIPFVEHRRIFDAFCWNTKKLGTRLYSIENLYISAEKAYDYVKKTRPYPSKNDDIVINDWLNDIINITNLLVKETYDEYSFIHKTIEEYHVASCIKNAVIDQKKEFYAGLVNNFDTEDMAGLYAYKQELIYLQMIDGHIFNEYFAIPLLKKVLQPLKKFDRHQECFFKSDQLKLLSNFLRSISLEVNIEWRNPIISNRGKMYRAEITIITDKNNSNVYCKLTGVVKTGKFLADTPDIYFEESTEIQQLIGALDFEKEQLTNSMESAKKNDMFSDLFK